MWGQFFQKHSNLISVNAYSSRGALDEFCQSLVLNGVVYVEIQAVTGSGGCHYTLELTTRIMITTFYTVRPPLSDLCLTRKRELIFSKEKCRSHFTLSGITTRGSLHDARSLHNCCHYTHSLHEPLRWVAPVIINRFLSINIHCTLIYALHAAYTSARPLKGISLHAGLTTRCTTHSLHAQIHYILTTHSLHVYFSLHAGDHYTRG